MHVYTQREKQIFVFVDAHVLQQKKCIKLALQYANTFCYQALIYTYFYSRNAKYQMTTKWSFSYIDPNCEKTPSGLPIIGSMITNRLKC